MEGRNGMSMSGPASYYIQRGTMNSSPGSSAGIHSSQVMRPLSGPSTSIPTRLSGTFQMEAPILGNQGSGVSQMEPMKRKRGRPRKYGPEGTMSLGLSPLPSVSASNSGLVSMTGSGSVASTQKRGRGRPPGTGRKQQLASCGEWISSSAGTGFTPHVITISAGEDIASKIMSFSQQGPRAVCVLSACGMVSRVTLRQPASSGGSLTHEGRFEILSLSGSFLLTDDGGSYSRIGALSVSLSSSDGRVIGGGITGSLIAAAPAQVIVGSFIYGGTKDKINKPKLTESDEGGESHMVSPAFGPGLGRSSLLSGWPRPASVDMRNSSASHADIDLTRG